MSKTEQLLESAKKKKADLLEKKDRINEALVKVSAEVNSLETKARKERTLKGVQKVEASGFTIDEILAQLQKNQNVEDKKEVE